MHRILNTLEAGQVTRYHAAPSVLPQTVGLHSFGVAVLVLYIRPTASREMLIEALLHDSAEYFTGDVPFTTKQANPAVKNLLEDLEKKHREEDLVGTPTALTDTECALLKVCDTLDGLIWCHKWDRPGGPVLERWLGAWKRCQQKFEPLFTVEEWRNANDIIQQI